MDNYAYMCEIMQTIVYEKLQQHVCLPINEA